MKKPHPLKGRKVSKETIAKRLATLAANRAMRNSDEAPKPKRAYTKRKIGTLVVRTPEQLMRDVKEALWCIDRAVEKTRRKIASGELSLTDVSDEETFMYMAKRYLEGGLKP